MRTTESAVSTNQAAKLTGATYRRVHYLVTEGLLNHKVWPQGSGAVLRWTELDVCILGVLLDLMELGAGGPALEPLDLAVTLAEDPPQDGDPLFVVPGVGVVTDPEDGQAGWWVTARRTELVQLSL